jgi:hypothetical protein
MILTEAWKRPVTYLRFERGRNWVSKAVSWLARSYYTHVDLVVDIDQRLFVGAYPYKGVVLHNGTDKFDTEVFFKLVKPIPYELWVKELHKPYDWGAIWRFLLLPYPNYLALDERQWYCTELAAYLLEATGAKPYRGILTPDGLFEWVVKLYADVQESFVCMKQTK